jgi:hypothetical protein
MHAWASRLPGSRIFQAYGTHGTEAQGILPTTCQFLDGKTPFEILRLLKVVKRIPLAFAQGLPEPQILLPRQGCITRKPKACSNGS